MSDRDSIIYRFHLPRGTEEITLEFDSGSYLLRQVRETPPAEWARLDFHQCSHCPLTREDTPFCPLAQGLSGFVEGFDGFYSYEEADIEVVTRNRRVVARKPLQHGMASLIGLIGATSGCPHLAFFRPMARFHLPFSDDDETLYRVFAMHLLGHYLRSGATGKEDAEAAEDAPLAELARLSQAATRVNRDMADRLRAAFSRDVAVNAIVTLDNFAQAIPYAIADRLDDLREMFSLPRREPRRFPF